MTTKIKITNEGEKTITISRQYTDNEDHLVRVEIAVLFPSETVRDYIWSASDLIVSEK